MNFDWSATLKSLDMFEMQNKLPSELYTLVESNNPAIVPSFQPVTEFEQLTNSPEIRTAFMPWAFKIYTDSNQTESLNIYLNQHRIDSTDEINIFSNYRQTSPGYQLSVFNVQARRGTSLKDAFNLLPIEVPRSIIASLTLDTSTYIRVLQKTETHTIILTNKMSHGLILRLACIMPFLFPTLSKYDVPAELPITLAADKQQEYYKLLYDWIKEPYANYLSNRQWTALRTALQSIKANHMDHLNRELENIKDTVNKYLAELQQTNKLRQRKLIELQGLQLQSEHAYDDLYNYIKRKDCITNIEYGNSNPGDVIFYILTPLVYWDVSLAERYLSPNSSNHVNTDYNRKAFKEIFIEQNAVLWIQAGFLLNFVSGRVTAYYSHYQVKGIPNTHLEGYNCWGDNASAIMQAIRNNQHEAAFEQALYACKSLNMADGTVINSMFHALSRGKEGYRNPCIELPGNEELITWDAYVQYLKHKEEEKDETDQDHSADG